MELTLFPAKSPLGAKKLVSFARTSDFTFDLLYADPKRPIAKVTVTGIEAAKDKHKDKRIKSVKVKALIGLTESGILEVSSAYALLDIYQDAKAKLTDTLGSVMSFFGGKKDNKDKGDGTDGDKEEEAPQEVDGSLNATNSTGNATAPVAVKSVMEKVDLKFTIDWQFQTPMTEAQKREIKSLMRKMDGEDQLRRVREEARNNLESYVYGTREFLYESDLEQVSTQEQRDALKSTLDVASEWMEDHAETASITDLRKHLDSLKTLREPMALRRTELGLRDPSVKAMEKALKKAQETVDSFEADLKKVEEEEKVLAGALAKVEAESAEKADKAEDAKDEEKKKESADDETKADKEEKPKKAKTPPPVSPNRPSPYVMNMYDSAKSTLKSTLEWFEATKAKQASKAATDEPVLLSKDLIAKQIFLGDRLGSFAKFVESEKAAREAQLKAQEKAKKDAKKAKAKKEEEAKANAAKEKTKDEKKDKSKEEKKEDVKDEL